MSFVPPRPSNLTDCTGSAADNLIGQCRRLAYFSESTSGEWINNKANNIYCQDFCHCKHLMFAMAKLRHIIRPIDD